MFVLVLCLLLCFVFFDLLPRATDVIAVGESDLVACSIPLSPFLQSCVACGCRPKKWLHGAGQTVGKTSRLWPPAGCCCFLGFRLQCLRLAW